MLLLFICAYMIFGGTFFLLLPKVARELFALFIHQHVPDNDATMQATDTVTKNANAKATDANGAATADADANVVPSTKKKTARKKNSFQWLGVFVSGLSLLKWALSLDNLFAWVVAWVAIPLLFYGTLHVFVSATTRAQMVTTLYNYSPGQLRTLGLSELLLGLLGLSLVLSMRAS